MDRLDKLQTLAIEGAKPQVTPFAPTDNLMIRKPDGIEFVVAKPAPRAHAAHDIGTVVDIAVGSTVSAPVIWYSSGCVTLLMDDADRRDRVTLEIRKSAQVTCLESLAGKKFGQRELLLMLRTTLKPCLGPAGDIVDVIRQVRFDIAQGGESVKEHGKSSIGKTMRAEISGKAAIPEYVTLSVPMFDGALAYIRSNVECCLEPDEQTQTFQFFPMPGELSAATVNAEAILRKEIVDRLDGADVPVYYGCP